MPAGQLLGRDGCVRRAEIDRAVDNLVEPRTGANRLVIQRYAGGGVRRFTPLGINGGGKCRASAGDRLPMSGG